MERPQPLESSQRSEALPSPTPGPAPDLWQSQAATLRSLAPTTLTAAAQAKAELAFDQLVQRLERGARDANVAHALRALVHTKGKVGIAAERVLRDAAAIQAPASSDLDGLRSVVAKAIGRVSDQETERAAFAMLAGVLTAFRAGSDRPVSFGVEAVAVATMLPPPPKLAVTTGFDPAIDGLRFDEDHSINDLQHYVDQRFGRFALEDLIHNGRTIELHHGARDETMASLVERGFDRFVRVRTPEAIVHNELYLVQNRSTGETRYVLTEIWGGTRLGHMQKLLKAAVVAGVDAPLRLDPRNVELHTEPLRRPEEIYRRTSRALLASGTVPASVVVGFKASILKELGRRAAQAKQLEFVQAALGNDPARVLRARADDAGADGAPLRALLVSLGDTLAVLGEKPSEVFRFSARLSALQHVEHALAAMVKEHPESGALIDDIASAHGFKVVVSGRVADRIPEGTFIDQTVVTYIDEGGARRNLLLTRNPYGEIAHELGRVLVDNGVDNVFVFGTAGGLQPGDALGDLHAPTQVDKPGGRLQFDNVALQIATSMPALLRSPMRTGGRVANVASPVDETLREVERLSRSGADIVEMELSHLAAALQGTDVRLSAVYLVSDLPGTDKTIEKQGHLELEQSLQKAVDVLIEGLGMRSVVLEVDPREPPLSPFAGAMKLASRALSLRGLSSSGSEGEQHGLLRYVVARYLMNGLSDRAIDSLLHDDKACPIQCAQLSPRWKEKALRELATPYTNAAVIAHLRALNAELSDAVVEVRRQGGNSANMSIHILGSVVKGRAGLGSDIDTLIETDDQALAERVFASRFGYRGAPRERNVVIGAHDYAMARGDHYGSVLSLGDGQQVIDDPDTLVKVWAKAAAPFGVALVPTATGDYQVVVDEDVLANAQVERDTNPIAERLLEHEKAFRKAIETDFLLRHLKALAPLADLTAVPLERMIHAGELLIRTRLIPALTPENLAAFFASPLGTQKMRTAAGQAFLQAAKLPDADAVVAHIEKQGIARLPLELLIDGEVAAALMGVGDGYDTLTVDLAAAHRVRRAFDQHGEGWVKPEVFPFFSREIGSAKKLAGKAFKNAVALQAQVRSSSSANGGGG